MSQEVPVPGRVLHRSPRFSCSGGEFADFLIQYLTEEEEAAAEGSETAADLDDLKHELEVALGKERFERQLSQVRAT